MWITRTDSSCDGSCWLSTVVNYTPYEKFTIEKEEVMRSTRPLRKSKYSELLLGLVADALERVEPVAGDADGLERGICDLDAADAGESPRHQGLGSGYSGDESYGHAGDRGEGDGHPALDVGAPISALGEIHDERQHDAHEERGRRCDPLFHFYPSL